MSASSWLYAELTVWRVDLYNVTTWQCDELVMWRVDWQPSEEEYELLCNFRCDFAVGVYWCNYCSQLYTEMQLVNLSLHLSVSRTAGNQTGCGLIYRVIVSPCRTIVIRWEQTYSSKMPTVKCAAPSARCPGGLLDISRTNQPGW